MLEVRRMLVPSDQGIGAHWGGPGLLLSPPTRPPVDAVGSFTLQLQGGGLSVGFGLPHASVS